MLVTPTAHKIDLSLSHGVLTWVLYLAPHKLAKTGLDVCGMSTTGCRDVCIFYTGRGQMPNAYQARVARTKLFVDDPATFRQLLFDDLCALWRKSVRDEMVPAFRPNGTSDLPWESMRLFKPMFTAFRMITFYDYTKHPKRYLAHLARQLPENYHLTFSRSETNHNTALRMLEKGGTVAVPFRARKGEPLPSTWHGHPVFDADVSDFRPNNPPGVAGLRAKGRAIYDDTGFVQEVS